MAFANTAAYFQRRAGMARSAERRQELTDAARFYRELAAILPAFPRGYASPQTRTDLDARAELCLALAKAVVDPDARAKLLRLAERYGEPSGAVARRSEPARHAAPRVQNRT